MTTEQRRSIAFFPDDDELPTIDPRKDDDESEEDDTQIPIGDPKPKENRGRKEPVPLRHPPKTINFR
jgi:hypothetical protein